MDHLGLEHVESAVDTLWHWQEETKATIQGRWEGEGRGGETNSIMVLQAKEHCHCRPSHSASVRVLILLATLETQFFTEQSLFTKSNTETNTIQFTYNSQK